MFTENLDDYENMPETTSCYLDGRFFEKVFVNYPGLLTNPLRITLIEKPGSEKHFIEMKQNHVNTEYPGLLRVVITGKHGRHSNLLILDYQNGIAHRFEPLGKTAPHYYQLNEIIEDYLSLFFNFKVQLIDVDLNTILNEKNPACFKSGFCNAYNILYAYCYINGREFDPTHIRRFAKKIETTYGTLPMEGAEIEYGLWGNDNPDQGRNMLVGGGIGALGGAIIGGPTGLLLGGLGGVAVGSIL